MIVLMASRPKVMRQFAIGLWLKAFGWLATAAMGLASAGMIVTWGQ